MNFARKIKKEFSRNGLDLELIIETKHELWVSFSTKGYEPMEYLFSKYLSKKEIPILVKEITNKYYENVRKG